MNLRPSTLLWMLFFACGFFGLYMMKYKVQAVKSEVAALERQIVDEKRNLHVLEAEWSYLNRPERLRLLSDKYLALEPVTGKQMTDYASLPIGDPAQVMKVAAKNAEVKNAEAKKTAAKGDTGKKIALASGAGHGR